MTYLGTVPPKVWDIAIRKARAESIPIPQPEDTPYILIKQVSETLLIAMSGVFKQQAIDVYIIPVYPPGLKPKNMEAVQGKDIQEARDAAMSLLTQAVEEHANEINP